MVLFAFEVVVGITEDITWEFRRFKNQLTTPAAAITTILQKSECLKQG